MELPTNGLNVELPTDGLNVELPINGLNVELPTDGLVVFFSPHPDDEILSSGALLLRLKERNNSINIHYLTSGSERRAQGIREAEAREVCAILEAAPTFHRFGRDDDVLTVGHVLARTIAGERPDLIIMPWGKDPHPTHRFSSRIVTMATTLSLCTASILQYSIWNPLPNPNYFYRFDEPAMKAKLGLLHHYDSQLRKNDLPSAVKGLNRFYGVISGELDSGWKNNGSRVKDDPMEAHGDPSAYNSFDVGAEVFAETFRYFPLIRKPAVLALGDIFFDLLPEPVIRSMKEGSTRTIISSGPGGNAANFAAALARFGRETALYASIGNDWRGSILEKELSKEGVARFLLCKESVNTAMTLALAFRDGSRHFISDFGANLTFCREELPILEEECWNGFQHLHRAGFFWLPELRGEPNVRLMRFAKKIGLTTSLDVGTPISSSGNVGSWSGHDVNERSWSEHNGNVGSWSGHDANEVQVLMKHIDVFFGNESEILGAAGGEAVVGEANLEWAADRLLAKGAGMVIVHQGEKGASLFSVDSVLRQRAGSVVPENPTGAGDVFNAAFIHGLLAGNPLDRCLAFAVAAGTLHVADPANPYPSFDDVTNFMSSQEVE